MGSGLFFKLHTHKSPLRHSLCSKQRAKADGCAQKHTSQSCDYDDDDNAPARKCFALLFFLHVCMCPPPCTWHCCGKKTSVLVMMMLVYTSFFCLFSQILSTNLMYPLCRTASTDTDTRQRRKKGNQNPLLTSPKQILSMYDI